MLGAILPLHDVRYLASIAALRHMTETELFSRTRRSAILVRSGDRTSTKGLIGSSAAPRAWRGGARRDRTDDLLLAKQALSQLSYGPGPSAGCAPAVPATNKMVGLGRFELPTSRLSSARSNQLSYKPEILTRLLDRPAAKAWRGARPRRKRNEDGGVPPEGLLRAPMCFQEIR
jgi:hypothetical protein